jgi:hypothetical protein
MFLPKIDRSCKWGRDWKRKGTLIFWALEQWDLSHTTQSFHCLVAVVEVSVCLHFVSTKCNLTL